MPHENIFGKWKKSATFHTRSPHIIHPLPMEMMQAGSHEDIGS